MDFDGLWLNIQFFHDSMLRSQPNSVTSDPERLSQAVDLILDVAYWRLMAELDQDLKEDDARVEIAVLQRRLQRMELMLREDFNQCGKGPKVLAGCMVGVKRPKYKDRLWTRIFGSEPGEQQSRNEDRSFRIRDVAGLLRIEDFLTFVSNEFDRQLGPREGDAEEGVVLAAMAHLDSEVKSFFTKKDCRTAKQLKAEWAPVLRNPRFRAAVVREMSALVNEGIAFLKKNGYAVHRDGCELWAKPQGSIARVFSNVSVKGEGSGMSRTGTLTSGFWRKDSGVSKK
ncbi:hypothetical protein ACHAPT_001180 [Fusarium lateritium]